MQTDLDSWASLPLYLSHAYSCCQLSGVAGGLCYLHSCNVAHGDLRGVRPRYKSWSCFVLLTHGQSNILVDRSCNTRITDSGLTVVTQSASRQRVHTVRWTAPEVLKGGAYSKEADVFSFAMVMIEVCHG